MKRVLVTLAVAATMSFPAFAAETFADLELFENQGQCQSAIVDVRNGVRKLSTINVSGSTVSLFCKLITSGPNKGKYRIIVG
jgi:hypothetical protein